MIYKPFGKTEISISFNSVYFLLSNSFFPKRLIYSRINGVDETDFHKGKAVLQEWLDKYNINVDVNTVGLAKSSATTLAINLNKSGVLNKLSFSDCFTK